MCAAPGLQLVQETSTPCVCFLPLCCSETSTYAGCSRCGATMSAAFYPLPPAPTPSSGATAVAFHVFRRPAAAPLPPPPPPPPPRQGKEEALLPPPACASAGGAPLQ